MTVPAFHDAATAAGTTSATVAVTKPANTVANDIMVALIYIEHATATVTLPQNALINNGAGITNSQTTVPYDTGTNLPTAGEITIDNEVIIYTGGGGAASGTLTGCTRGAYGTTAATHADNAVISTWVRLRDSSQTGPAAFDYRHITFWKRVSSSEPTTYTWTFSVAAYREAFIISITGCITSGSPIDVEAATINGSADAVPIAPSITTLTTDTLLLGIFTSADGGTAVWAPGSSGMTERVDFVSMSCYDVAQAAAAASGSKTISCTGGANPEWHVGALIALKPPTTVLAVKGAATALAPVASPAGAATITALVGTATALSPVASVGGAVNVSAVVCTATALAPVAGVTGGGTTVQGVVATATALSPVATINAGANVSGIVATATALAPVAAVSIAANVSAIVCTATALAPVATIGGGANVSAPVSAASALSPIASVSGGGTTVQGVVSTATALSPPASLQAGANIAAAKGAATAQAPAAGVTAGPQVGGVVCAATALSPAAAVAAAVNIIALKGAATALAPASSVGGGSNVQALKGAAAALCLVASVTGGTGSGPVFSPTATILRGSQQPTKTGRGSYDAAHEGRGSDG